MANTSTSGTTRTTRTQTSELYRVILATARLCKVFGWDEETVEEYCRPILSKANPERALAAFRSIYDRDRIMPQQSEVIEAANKRESRERWITIERQGVDNVWRGYACKIPIDAKDPSEFLKPAERLVHDSAPRERKRFYRWHECEEGREFMRHFEKFVGKKAARNALKQESA